MTGTRKERIKTEIKIILMFASAVALAVSGLINLPMGFSLLLFPLIFFLSDKIPALTVFVLTTVFISGVSLFLYIRFPAEKYV